MSVDDEIDRAEEELNNRAREHAVELFDALNTLLETADCDFDSWHDGPSCDSPNECALCCAIAVRDMVLNG